MKGCILHISNCGNKGVISGENGERYDFSTEQLLSDSKLKVSSEVDFIPEDNIATKIFLLDKSPSVSVDEIKAKALNFKENPIVGQVLALFTNGIHNKFGVISSILFFISIFLTVFYYPHISLLNSHMREASILDSGLGSIIFILSLSLIAFFYGGATKKYTKIIMTLIVVFTFIGYFNHFIVIQEVIQLSGQRRPPIYLDFTTPYILLNIAAIVMIVISSLKASYVSDPKTI